jgi:hypothetical protein
MRKVFNIILITISIFIFFNILIILILSIYDKNIKNKYSDEAKNIIQLKDNDLDILYRETWKNFDKFRYLPFVGFTETNRTGKFVNFDESKGRYINRPAYCNINIFLYGGSTTFGYNVRDSETIGQYLQNLLGKNYCIYNHGRAYYYSKQENALLINHIEEKKKINIAIFIDGVNERCDSYAYDQTLSFFFDFIKEKNHKAFLLANQIYIDALPIVRLSNSILKRSNWVDRNAQIILINSCQKKIKLTDLFETRIKNREGICKINKINCYTFLQPFPGVSGIQSEKNLAIEYQKAMSIKYNELKNVNGVIDIKSSLNTNKNLSYIDGVHYSQLSNKLIAEEIYKNYIEMLK